MKRTVAGRETWRAARELLAGAGIAAPPVDCRVLAAHAGLEIEYFDPVPAMTPGRVADSLCGFIDLETRTIHVNERIRGPRRTFTILHEIAHWILVWHRETLLACPFDLLPAGAAKSIEREADRFASDCLFVSDMFEDEARCAGFSAESFRFLQKRFRASTHAALIRYLRAFPGEAALMQMEEAGCGRTLVGRIFTSGKFPAWIPVGVPLPDYHPFSRLCMRASLRPFPSWEGRWPEDGPRPRTSAFAVDNGFSRFVMARILPPRSFCA